MSHETAAAVAERNFMLLAGKEVLVRRIRCQGIGDQSYALSLPVPVPARIDPSRAMCFQRYRGDGRLLQPVYPIEFLGRHPGLSKMIPLWTYGAPLGSDGPVQTGEEPAFALMPGDLRPSFATLPGVPKIMGAADGPARIIVRLYVRVGKGAAHRQELVDLTAPVVDCNLADLNEIVAGRAEAVMHVMPRDATSWDFIDVNRAEVMRAVRAAFGISRAQPKLTQAMLDELRRGPRREPSEMIVARLRQADGSCLERDVAPILLRMSLLEIQALRDGHGTTDALGRYFRFPGGGHSDVAVVEAAQRFFAVGDLSEVTEEILAAARHRLGIHPMQRTALEGVLQDMTTTAAVTARDVSPTADALRGDSASAVTAACQKGSRNALAGLQRVVGAKGAVAGARGEDGALHGSAQQAAVQVGATVGELVQARSQPAGNPPAFP